MHKSSALPCLVLMILLTGCAKPHLNIYVRVHPSGESCIPGTVAKDSQVEEVYVFPGEAVYWVNTMDDPLLISDPDACFGGKDVTVNPGARAKLSVKASAPEDGRTHAAYSLVLYRVVDGQRMECEGGVAGPTVKVGDPP